MKKDNCIVYSIIILGLIFFVNTCIDANEHIKSTVDDLSNQVLFDKDKWLQKQGDYYPFRDEMLDSILHTQLVKSLNKTEIIKLLGEPSYYREDRNYLYYLIKKKVFFGVWTLHTKTLVIKIKDDKTVKWIKIHE